ncbi:MAG: hypothetical protein J6A52_01335 [Bacilli bacterium]|nr:hypothetical protein [Bacilli bacterium]
MGSEYNIEKLVSEIDFNANFIGYNRQGVVLTNREIDVLKRNSIDYEKFNSVSELLYEIDDVISEVDDMELEEVASNISERNYYLNTKK